MALSVSSNLIIDEEFRIPSTGSTDNEVTMLSADATLFAYLNSVNPTPDTGFPQYPAGVGPPFEHRARGLRW